MALADDAGTPVLTEVQGYILMITLNRPDAMNAIDGGLAAGVLAAIDRLETDASLTVGVLTGRGRGFCSGMDLKAFAKQGVPAGFSDFVRRGSRKPLVAAIEGFALAGGLELALTCDVIVASRRARLGLPEVRVGLFAAGGGLLRLTQRLPYSVAAEMVLTAEPISAEEALRHGLVSVLAGEGQALTTALELAERIGANAPLAVAASKQLLQAAGGRTADEFFELQRPHMEAIFSSDDAEEGARAFAEKRTPRWSGT